tara:strand:- start:351 stop:485 length:135 start_codon:yes stop_codon:yes gene_type:complete
MKKLNFKIYFITAVISIKIQLIIKEKMSNLPDVPNRDLEENVLA